MCEICEPDGAAKRERLEQLADRVAEEADSFRVGQKPFATAASLMLDTAESALRAAGVLVEQASGEPNGTERNLTVADVLSPEWEASQDLRDYLADTM